MIWVMDAMEVTQGVGSDQGALGGGGVDLEHPVAVRRKAVDALVRADGTPVPLPAALGELADERSFHGRRVDPDDRGRTVGDAVDASVAAQQTSVPLLTAGVGPSK